MTKPSAAYVFEPSCICCSRQTVFPRIPQVRIQWREPGVLDRLRGL